MGLLAKYLADYDSRQHLPDLTVPGTDRQDYEDLVFQGLSPTKDFTCLATNLLNVLPIPREDVTLPEIINFKRKRYDELQKFRQLMEKYHMDMSKCHSSDEANHIAVSFSEEIAIGIRELEVQMRESKLATAVGSVKTVIDLKSPALWMTGGAILGHATKVADLPLGWEVAGIVASGTIQVVTYCIGEGIKRRAAMRDTPFTYLYHAKLEHVAS
jgi:hypothetical protein